MWSHIVKQISSRKLCRNSSLSVARNILGLSQDSFLLEKSNFRRLLELNSPSADGFPVVGNHVSCSVQYCRSYASVGAAMDVDTDVEGEEEVESSADVSAPERDAKMDALRKRQAKIEAEAWQEAAKEYVELLNVMCEKKLVPELPYMKSLFLEWFESLRDKIGEEQELIKKGKSKAAYAKHFHLLPPDMMAIITMHKLMGLVMCGGVHGCARVVETACIIGDAIEQEVRVNYFLEKTKKKKAENDAERAWDVSGANRLEQEKVRKQVTTLMKKNNLRAVRRIVNTQIESQPWGQDVKAKTAYVQPPANQLARGPPDIRPAFIHTSRFLSKGNNFSFNKNNIKRYGVIDCDPLIRKGPERTVHGHPRYANASAPSQVDKIPLPLEPDTEDETLIRKWKWNVKSIKKENGERVSQHCEAELKLAVARKLKEEEGFFYPHNHTPFTHT